MEAAQKIEEKLTCSGKKNEQKNWQKANDINDGNAPAAQAPLLLMQGEEVHEHNSVPAIALMEREEEAEKEQECYHCAHCNVTLASLWNLTRHEGSNKLQPAYSYSHTKWLLVPFRPLPFLNAQTPVSFDCFEKKFKLEQLK